LSNFLKFALRSSFTVLLSLLATASFAATITAANSGNWANPMTWAGATVPVDGDDVIIPAGITVTYDGNTFTTAHPYVEVGGKLTLGPGQGYFTFAASVSFRILNGGELRNESLDETFYFSAAWGVNVGHTLKVYIESGGKCSQSLDWATGAAFNGDYFPANSSLINWWNLPPGSFELAGITRNPSANDSDWAYFGVSFTTTGITAPEPGSGGDEAVIPTVTTGSAADITTTSATLGGNATDNGGAEITARGIEYSTTEGFTEGAGTQVAADEMGTGEFTVAVTGLTAATTYYYRAYATNSEGTAYGDEVSFTTTAAPVTGGVFWFDDFEDASNPSSGTRTPSNNGGSTTAYFKRTDGSDMDLTTVSDGPYLSKEGTYFWAGEDHDGSFSSAEQTIVWSGIDISGKTDISFKGLFAANSGT